MINIEELTSLCSEMGASAVPDAPVSALTTFKIGGPCAALVTLPSVTACQRIVPYLHSRGIPYTVVGRGSNLLCPDEGYAGVILKLSDDFADEPIQEDGMVVCGAGLSLRDLCLYAQKHSLTGLEFAFGIPGSVGGAVFMNAGAYDGEFSQVTAYAEVMDAEGNVQKMDAAQLKFSYRHSVFMEQKQLMILRVAVKLKPGDSDAIDARMQDLLGRRKEKQPLEYPSAGSTFKRPAEGYASRLIDECGLKGYRAGDAQVSEKHAGFVVNRGDATYADVMAVCAHVQETVLAQKGIKLELEPEVLRV
ncbi:MAG: UDP-N-acetylmuramate dehydrogenase [Oscillospiraceae bacterium]|nr:UDP-N-acetylmuramate dehydrogenase [Oscillospiraceae bacterium]